MSISRREVLATLLAAPAMALVPRSFAQTALSLQASYSTNAFDDLMAQARTLYAKRSSTAIDYRRPTPATHDEHLKQTLRWAIAGDLPDVSFQANSHISRLARSNIAKPLDALSAADKAWSDADAASAIGQIGQVGGAIYGIPFQISVPVCVVNLELAARAGVSTGNLPQDWTGLLALAKQISSEGSEIVGGFFDFGSAWTFQALITAQGGRMATPDEGDIAFDGPEGLVALDLVRGFGEAGMVDMSQSQALQAFGAGTIGVLATSNNVLAGLEKQAGDRFKIATVAWPLPSPDGRLPAGGRTGVIFADDPTRQASAWDFLRFMSSPEVQAIVVQSTGAIPVDPEAMERSGLLAQFYAEHPNHKAGLARSKQLIGWYAYPGENTVKITDVMIEHLRSVATLAATPEDALLNMSRDVRALLSKTN